MTGKNSVRDIIMSENVFNDTNFSDWDMNLKIVLGSERLLYTIERPIGPKPGANQVFQLEIWKTHHDDNMIAQSIILVAMTQQFHRQNKGLDPYEMIVDTELRQRMLLQTQSLVKSTEQPTKD